MGKKKLSREQIISIANSYANDSDALNISYFAEKYSVSKTAISDAIHKAISEKFVSEKIAKNIAAKAVRQERIRREQLGYRPSVRLKNFYNKLIYDAWTEKPKAITLENLEATLLQTKNQLATFEEVFSSSDEFPLSADQLEDQIESLEEKIRMMKLHT